MEEVKSRIAEHSESEVDEYVPPVVRVMSESEILSAFQVSAAPTMGWWVA